MVDVPRPARPLPYGRHSIDEADIAAVVEVLKSDFLTGGPVVDRFEQAFAADQKCDHAVVCANGTAALHLAAIAADIGPGDLAIVPAVTFLATANAIRMQGAEVIFADVDADTGLMTLDSFNDACKRSSKPPKAVLPVYLCGQATDPDIAITARAKGMTVIADACHALGGTLADGSKPGGNSQADMATFSFHPVKAVAMGEGGMITTDNPDFAARMRKVRHHAMERSSSQWDTSGAGFDNGEPNPWFYEISELGYNYRASAIQCALGLSQLGKLADFHRHRDRLAAMYDARLKPLAPLVRPVPRMPGQSGWHLYAVLIDFEAVGKSRRQVMQVLLERGVGTQVHYIPVSDQPYYRARYGEQNLPGARHYYQRTLSLPLYPDMSGDDLDHVVDTLTRIVG